MSCHPRRVQSAHTRELVQSLLTRRPPLDQHTSKRPAASTHRPAHRDNVAVHEFGHTFGLDDYVLEGGTNNPNYYGIMDVDDVKYKKDDQIKQDDRDALRKIYESHTRNEGW